MANSTNNLYPAAVIAHLFNITERHVNRLAKDGVIQKAARGKYELVTCVKSYVRYLQESSAGGNILNTDFGTENIRVKKLTADKLQLEVDLLKGNLIPRSIVDEQINNIILSARAKLLILPTRLAKVAINAKSLKEIENAAQTIIYESLSELSNAEPYQINEIMGTTGKIKSVAMGRTTPIS